MSNIDWFSGQPFSAIPDYIAWQDAVKAADNGDSKRLVELLRSPEHWPGSQARIWIADLLARHNLKKKRGGQAMPAYRVSAVEGDLNDAAAHYRYFRRKKMSSEEAVKAALRSRKRERLYLSGGDGYLLHTDKGIDEMVSPGEIEALTARIGRRRGSTERQGRRRKQPQKVG